MLRFRRRNGAFTALLLLDELKCLDNRVKTLARAKENRRLGTAKLIRRVVIDSHVYRRTGIPPPTPWGCAPTALMPICFIFPASVQKIRIQMIDDMTPIEPEERAVTPHFGRLYLFDSHQERDQQPCGCDRSGPSIASASRRTGKARAAPGRNQR
jgi:hypothetical protein